MTHTQEREDEILVILAKEGEESARSFIERTHAIIHSVSPRVFVIRKPTADADRVEPGREILIATAGEVPKEILDTLSNAEELWIAAWSLRNKPKSRLNEGLPWDAPGLQSPDK